MKKISFILTFIFFPLLLCYPQTAKLGSIELYTGIPYIYETLDNDGKETLATSFPAYSFGIGAVNYSVFSNEKTGIAFYGNFIFPGDIKQDINDGKAVYRQNDSTVFDFTFGMGYKVFSAGKFIFPVTLGLHLFYLTSSSINSAFVTYDLTKMSMGLGGSAGGEFHLNDTIYFFLKVHGNLDFMGITKRTKYTGINIGGKMAYYIDGTDFTAFMFHFGVIPVLGAGIKLDGFAK